MPTRKLEEKNIRKLTKTGRHSICVTIPIEIVRKLKWKEKQKVVVKKSGSKIVISDWKK
jgi:bifunctional DNA-binding transcriptional regulator/antitoxin component of YhaV-PrlF toxin-antitoxin module